MPLPNKVFMCLVKPAEKILGPGIHKKCLEMCVKNMPKKRVNRDILPKSAWDPGSQDTVYSVGCVFYKMI